MTWERGCGDQYVFTYCLAEAAQRCQINADGAAECFSCSTAAWTLRTSMQIRDLDPEAPEEREFCAQLLVEEFRDIAPDAWPIIDKARETVDECLRNGPVRVAHVNGTIVGWIGGHHVFSRVWELHPLVVARMAQKQGVGRALVADLERIAAARGAMTLILGSDDEVGLTSLAGIELYPNPLEHLSRLEDRRGHAFTFYLKCGFVVTGVVPDASGFGQPDIHMAKRVGSR